MVYRLGSKSDVSKVTDPKKIVSDAVLLAELDRQGIDGDYVEFVQDYDRKIKGVSSPYAKFYRDLKSNKRFAVISQLPMVDADGIAIEAGWNFEKGIYTSRNNLFSATVDGIKAVVKIRNDQPDGKKAGATLAFSPQLYLDGVEQKVGEVNLLPVDPVNSNYANNILEWDYGICKRRLRLIEGRILGSWFFESNPKGDITIKYNQSGDFRLRLQYSIDEDTEVIKREVFDSEEYPLTISDSLVFYPDPDPESTSVDGYAIHQYAIGSGQSWATLVGAAGSAAYDDLTALVMYIQSDNVSDKWRTLDRPIILFDTSSLPDSAVISAAVLSVYGKQQTDVLVITPNLNVYSSAPVSNIALAAGDYHSLGSTAFCDTPITYAGFSLVGYNDFILNASGRAAISLTGVTKLGLRNANYDVAVNPPAWTSLVSSRLDSYSAEQGAGYKPKLVVTFSVSTNLPTVTTQAASGIGYTSATGNGNITNTGETADVALSSVGFDTNSSTMLQNGDFLASRSDAGHEGQIYKSTDKGVSWGLLSTLPDTDGAYPALYTAANGYVYVAYQKSGSTGKIYRSTDSGATWSTVKTLDTDETIWQFTEDASGNIFASGYSIESPAGTTHAKVWKSSDHGTTWDLKVTFAGARHCHGIYYNPFNDWVYVATGDGVGQKAIYRSKDGGDSWSSIYTDIQITALLGKGTDNEVYLGSDWTVNTIIYKFADAGGASVTPTAVADLGDHGYVFTFRKVADRLVFGTNFYEGIYSTFYISTDSTWSAFTLLRQIYSGDGGGFDGGTNSYFPLLDTVIFRDKTVTPRDGLRVHIYGNCDHRGIVYGTTSLGDPGNVAPAASGYDDYEDEAGPFSTGAFTRSLTGLVPVTTHYARAYAHNSAGYSYGGEVSFTTTLGLPTVTTQAVSGIADLYATGNGNITDTGAPSCDKRGFVYGTSSHGNPGDVAPGASGYDDYVEESGSFGTGAFANYLVGLTPSTTYYVRAYAHNSYGYSYGGEVNFNSTAPALVVKTHPATNIESGEATGNGYASVGTGTLDEYGFEWGLVSGGPYPNSVTQVQTFSGNFSLQMTGLGPSTPYYYRAKAHSTDFGWGYGSEKSFTTLTALPTIQTTPPSAVTSITIDATGNITSTGGDPTCDKRGFVYGLISKPLPGNVAPGASGYTSYEEDADSFGTGSYTLTISGLTVNKIYYLRAYCHNSFGYRYGTEIVAVTSGVTGHVNFLYPNGTYNTGIRFDTSPGGAYPHPYGGTIPHYILCLDRDSTFTPGGIWGYINGNFVYEYNYYNDNFYTDRYRLTDPLRRTEGIVKIKWKAHLLRSGYPYGQYKRQLRTHSANFEGAAFDIPYGGCDTCEIFYNNPFTTLPWTLAEADDLIAGVSLGHSGGFGVACCDMVRCVVLWANALASADGATDLGGTNRRLYGTVVEDEAETCQVWFEWGATNAYGNTTALQTKAKGDTFTADIDIGALPSIHFRAGILTDCGETFYSADAKFPTVALPAQSTIPHRLVSGGFI